MKVAAKLCDAWAITSLPTKKPRVLSYFWNSLPQISYLLRTPRSGQLEFLPGMPHCAGDEAREHSQGSYLLHNLGEPFILGLVPPWASLPDGIGSESAAKIQPRETRAYSDPQRSRGGDGPYREYVSIKGVKVNEEVNASISQGGHAVGVVLGGIDMVDPNRVDAEILHQRRVTSTLL